MCKYLKAKQACLSISTLLLLGLYPPLSSGGIDRKIEDLDSGSVKTMVLQNGSQRLIGTAVGRDPSDNFAVIEDGKSRQQRMYREGAQAGPYRIKKILPDRIIIYNSSGEAVVKLQRSLVTISSGALGTAEKTAEINPVRKSGPRDRHYVIDSEEVDATLADPQKMIDTIEMRPGKLFNWDRGVRISSIAPDSVFTAMGLLKGDLLLGINDKEIKDTGEAVSMMQTMFDAGEAELRVRRRARTYRIHLQDLLVM